MEEENDDGMIDGDMEDDEQAIEEEAQQMLPNSKPPEVPEDGTYITALNEAGVDPQRIEQIQQGKYICKFLIVRVQ